MPPKTKKQKRAAGIARAVKAGKLSKSEVGSSVREMASSMTDKQLSHFSKGKVSGKKKASSKRNR